MFILQYNQHNDFNIILKTKLGFKVRDNYLAKSYSNYSPDMWVNAVGSDLICTFRLNIIME